MPILFLDFDGVLHPEHCHESKHFCCLPILEEVLRQAPEWKVVVTSTWRLDQPFEAILQRFSPDIARVIEGVTPKYCELSNVPDTLVGYQRIWDIRWVAVFWSDTFNHSSNVWGEPLQNCLKRLIQAPSTGDNYLPLGRVPQHLLQDGQATEVLRLMAM